MDSKDLKLDNKEIIDLIVNQSFKEESIIDTLVYKNKNPIKLLNKTYQEVVEDTTNSSPVIYLYHSHPTEEYKSSDIGAFYINPTVIMNNYISVINTI